ncbi:MAG: group 1 truncated hemoglobin [Candidatus Cloacimonetes bacterium]|nr:group 1 truncated hemoglobin [Candidatus Cloacimonadota bacterium]
MTKKIPLIQRIGGRETLQKVHKKLYDKLFAHPWLKLYFQESFRPQIEDQQTDFMTNAMGGFVLFVGKPPIPTHMNMNISEQLFDIRHNYLKNAILDCGVSEDLAKEWLKIDLAFKKAICKKDVSECEKRHKNDKIMDYPNPALLNK